MAYETFGVDGKWIPITPRAALKALLDEYPDGVSFVNSMGSTVDWRKAPRDEALLSQMTDIILRDEWPDRKAEDIYALLENRGVL